MARKGEMALSMINSLVLITTAVNPPEGVFCLEMKNVTKRRIASKGAVLFWSALGVKKIVVADATGQFLFDNSEINMFEEIGVKLEQISYIQNNELVVTRGKGYGEGALIKYAINNSDLLKYEDGFFKCTGKVYCRNFAEIFDMVQKNNIKNIFWRYILEETMDTRFFYTSKDFCRDFLLPAYENTNDMIHATSEHCIFKMANQSLIKGSLTRPLLTGFSGSSNEPYPDVGLGFLDQHFPCWFSQ